MSTSSGAVTQTDNRAFSRALVAHLGTLSDHEKILFSHGNPESVLELATRCDSDHAQRSRSRRWAGVFCDAMNGLKRYFHVIETVVSSHPEIAAIVWGGFKFVLEVS